MIPELAAANPMSPEDAPANLWPGLGEAMLAAPRFLCGSDWIGHLPLLAWAVQSALPSTVLGAGLRSAEGYLAVCQAVAGLSLPTRAWGFGISAEGYADVQQHHASHYAGFSRLARVADTTAALTRFSGGLFDLILLDGGGPETDPQHMVDLIAAQSSRNGVAVLSGLGVNGPADALLAALAARFPLRVFGDAPACAVVLIGAEPPEPLRRIIDPDLPPAAVEGMQKVFVRLGAATRFDHEAGQIAAVQAEMAQVLVQREEAVRASAVAQAELATAVANLRQSHEDRLRDSQLLSAELEKLAIDREQVRAEIAAQLAAAAEEAEATLAEARAEAEAAMEAMRAEAAAAAVAAVRVVDGLRAEMAAQNIRAFDASQELRGEIAWHDRELTAKAQALEAAAQRIAALEGTLETAAQKTAADQRAAAGREARLRVQVRLREWQKLRAQQSPRFGREAAPSGGDMKSEIAAVARHALFDADWYMATYPDAKAGKLTAAEHFTRHGFYEGRNPGPRFRLVEWFMRHPEALARRENPLLDPALLPTSA